MRYLFGLYLVFSIFFSSFVLLIYQNSSRVLFQTKELTKISFTFKNMTTEENAQKISKGLLEKYKLKEAQVLSPADQYADFLKSFSMYNQGAFDPDEILQLIPYAVDFIAFDIQDLKKIRTEILSQNIFQENNTSAEWLDKLRSIAVLIENMGRILFLFLFASTALLTVATIRILISEDDYKNKIRSYLGESFQEIYRRYLWSMTKLYVAAISVGFLMTYFVYLFFVLKIKSNFKFSFIADRLDFLNTDSIILLLVGFLTAFGLGAFVSLKQLFTRIYHEE